MKIVLPSLSTVKKWVGTSKCLPGFNKQYFNQIKLKTNTMNDTQKHCIIVFDEMSVKSFLEYNKWLDRVEGLEDLGILGRTKLIGKQIMVFMARGIYSTWKIPLGYFVSHSSMPGQILQDLIGICI